VYASLGAGWQHGAAFLIAAVATLRALLTRESFWWWCAAGALVLCAGNLFRDDALLLKLYPVAVNAVMLCTFAVSLWKPPCVVERLARLTEPNLPAEGVRYTEMVTLVWCAFFVLNGSAALYTALFANERVWVLYNGLLAYVLMGTLILAERLWRARVMTSGVKGNTV
jgi:uncharacterized membrane protein